jgi:hypothetical protein
LFPEVVLDISTGDVQKDFIFQFMQKNGRKKGQKMTVVPEDPT